MPDAVVGESIVAEPDGSLIYRFDDWGRHVATQHGLTGEDLLEIEYWSATGLVTRLHTLGGGPDLTFSRDLTTLLPLEIDSGFGQQSVPTYDAIGNLETLTDPEGRVHQMLVHDSSGMEGLLKKFFTRDGVHRAPPRGRR